MSRVKGQIPDHPLGANARRQRVKRPANPGRLPGRQAGVALILALLILLVMTLAGVATMSSVNLQERMAGNQKRMADAQMAAEAAVTTFYEWLNEDPETRWGTNGWEETWGPDSSGGTLADYDYSRFRVDDICWDESPCGTAADGFAVVNTTGLAMAGAAPAGGEYSLEVILENRVIPLDMDPVFGRGIVSEDHIDFKGNVEIVNADVHSNAEGERAVRVTGGQSSIEDGSVTAVGGVDIPDRMCDDCVVSPADTMDIPLITEEMLIDWRAQATVLVDPDGVVGSPPEGSSVTVDAQGNCVFELEGSQSPDDPSLYYCEGDAAVKGDFTDATIIVDGDVTHHGAVKPDGDIDTSTGTATNFIAATGDMTFNGASGRDEAYFEGIFWANGSITQNGRAYIYGSIVAGGDTEGDIWFGGNLNFTGINDTSNPFVPTADFQLVAINAWRQVWDQNL